MLYCHAPLPNAAGYNSGMLIGDDAQDFGLESECFRAASPAGACDQAAGLRRMVLENPVNGNVRDLSHLAVETVRVESPLEGVGP